MVRSHISRFRHVCSCTGGNLIFSIFPWSLDYILRTVSKLVANISGSIWVYLRIYSTVPSIPAKPITTNNLSSVTPPIVWLIRFDLVSGWLNIHDTEIIVFLINGGFNCKLIKEGISSFFPLQWPHFFHQTRSVCAWAREKVQPCK
jgi:hypothetical protein